MKIDHSTVKEIADQLGESDPGPRNHIAAVIRLCGENFARNILAQTLEIEAQGGMILADGSRKRTTGGVFFYFCKQ